MKRTHALLSVLLLAKLHALHAVTPTKPNMVFILADDLGFAEIGANDSDRYINNGSKKRKAK